MNMVRYLQSSLLAGSLTAAGVSFSWSWREFLFAVGSAVVAAVIQFVSGRLPPPKG